MELYQKGLGEYARRFWQHYGHIEKCQDCGSELRVVDVYKGRTFARKGQGYKTAYVKKECTVCPSLAREIYPLPLGEDL